MLKGLRAFAKTPVARLLLIVLVISFALFGINNVIHNLGGTTVARIGDREVTLRDFQRAYQQQLDAVSRQTGQVPTNDQAIAMGVPGQTLSRLYSFAVLDQTADNLGLGVSDDQITDEIRTNSAFAGTLGNFDADTFRQVLQQNGYSENDFINEQTRAAKRDQIRQSLFDDAPTAQVATQLVNRYRGDTRTLDYFVIDSTSIPPVAEPTDDELKAYLTEHQAEFRTPETRTTDILILSPQTLADTKFFTSEQLAAEYEKNKASYSTVEQRSIVQVALPNQAVVDAFTAGKAAGKTFDQLVAENNLTTTDLGTLSQAQVSDAGLAQAAFGLAQGDFAIIPGIGGQRAVSVTAITPAGTKSLNEVAPELAKNLALSQARNEILDVLDQVEELRAALRPLPEIAARYHLKLSTIPVTSEGEELEGLPDIDDNNRNRVTEAIFNAEVGQLAPTIDLGSNRTAWIDVKTIDPARDQTFDEVREQLAQDWTTEKTNAAVTAEVEKAKADLAAGTPIDELALRYNQIPQLSQPISRQGITPTGTPVPPIDPLVAAAAFGGGVGYTGAAANSVGDQVIFHVAEVFPADGEADANVATAVAQNGRNVLSAEWVNGLRTTIGVVQNDALISQAIGQSTGQ